MLDIKGETSNPLTSVPELFEVKLAIVLVLERKPEIKFEFEYISGGLEGSFVLVFIARMFSNASANAEAPEVCVAAFIPFSITLAISSLFNGLVSI